MTAQPLGQRIHRATRRLSRENQWRIYRLFLGLNDILLTGLALRLAYYLRFDLNLPVFQWDVRPSLPYYQSLSIALSAIWALIFASHGLYQRRYLLGGVQEYARVFRASSVGLLLVIVAGFLEPDFILARGWLLLAWLLTFLFVASGRFSLRRIAYYLRRHGYFLSPALVVGTSKEGILIAEQLLTWHTSGLHVVGFINNSGSASEKMPGDLHILGTVDDIDTLIGEHGIEEIILATSALTRDEMVGVFKKFGFRQGVNLRLSSGMFELLTTGMEIKEMGYVPLVQLHRARLLGLDSVMKTALDLALTIPAVILLMPVYLFIALAIRLDSPGPIFYRRRVMGLNGRQFDAFKFRTMQVNGAAILAQYPDLQETLATKHKLINDPRITRVGAILRRWSLDELPQFFNVLRREMSLVGPRMISPTEMAEYGHWGMNLLTVRPGISGLWQVSGRADINYDERVRLDMHYIRNWTIWLDLQLIFQTIPAILIGRGAY